MSRKNQSTRSRMRKPEHKSKGRKRREAENHTKDINVLPSKYEAEKHQRFISLERGHKRNSKDIKVHIMEV